MSKILNVSYKQNDIAVLNLQSPYSIFFEEGKPTIINQENGKSCVASCINCLNPRCMMLEEEEIKCSSFANMSPDMDLFICPTDAIKVGLKRVEINAEKCIGCGLCVERCPVGALYMKNGKAIHNCNSNSSRIEMKVSKENISFQEDWLYRLGNVYKSGCIRKENDSVMTEIYKSIQQLSQNQQNKLARNLMICLGNWASLSRQGNVYMRMDGFYETVDQYGVVEIETGSDMLDVSRALLDDVAVVHSRYNIKKKDNHPLAICLDLPNKRTDYWQVVKDIALVTHIRINTITFGILLVFMWNLLEINDYDRFYIDVDNSSLREGVEYYLGRKINISEGHLGILENMK